MKNNKRVISLVLMLVLMLSTFSTAFAAADRDLVHNTTNVRKVFPSYLIEEGFLYGLLVKGEIKNYNVDVDGKLYKLEEVQEKFNNNPEITLEDAVKGLDVVEGSPEVPEGDLKVVEVSAINKTTIKVTFDNGDVENFTVAPLTNGKNTRTIIYKGGSYTVEVNFTEVIDVDKAEVESVVLNNYRRMTVTFNTEVDKATAENPANYYFELVEGTAGKLGTNVINNYSLEDIAAIGTWWTVEDANEELVNINAQSVNGKTVVTINFPHDARFGNEETLKLIDMAGVSGNDKELKENVNFLFAVRDVKDAKELRTIDTAVKEITVIDTKAPKLVGVTSGQTKVDLSKEVPVLANGNLVFTFDEPIKAVNTASDLLPEGVKVFVDGSELTTGFDKTFVEVTGNLYGESTRVKLNWSKVLPSTAQVGDSFVIMVSGLRDLAGKLYTDTIKFTVKVTETTTPADTEPKILGVEQVLDNVFRVESNIAGVEGDLVLKEAGFEKAEVKVAVPATEAVTLSNNVVKYYSYVIVAAKHDMASLTPNTIDFEGGSYIVRNVQVTGVKKALVTGATFTKNNMHIEIDQQAPILDKKDIAVKYDATNNELEIGFTDVNPSTWAKADKNEKITTTGDLLALQAGIFENDTIGYAPTVRVKVVYVDEKGKTVEKYNDFDYTDLVIATGNVTIDLSSTDLVVGTPVHLPSEAVYTVELPQGAVSDDYAGEIGSSTGIFAVDESGRTVKHGYTTVASTVTITVGKNDEADEYKVPQTSKQLISFIKATDEIEILVTGAPTRESVLDLNNYILNGKTMKELGATEADVTFVDAAVGADHNKEIRIKLPKNSVEKDAPANFRVEGLAHEDGGIMTPVETVLEGLTDNTAPSFISGRIAGDGFLELRFDEPLEQLVDATPFTMAGNFTVKINGVETQVTEVEVDGNLITIYVANDLKNANSVVVEVKVNNNGKIEITDEAGNALSVGPIIVK